MRVSWIFLGIFWIAVTCGFSHDRPVNWDKIPLIETKQTEPLEKVSNGKLQVTGMDKVLETSEATKSIKLEDEITDYPFSEKRSALLALETQKNPTITGHDEIKDDIIFPIEENSSFLPKDTQSENPKNVILLFINESGQDPLALWTNLRTSNHFPVHGFVHSCQNEGNLFRIPSSEYFKSKENEQGECEKFLRSNIDSLLSWAHRARKMPTGVVEDANASIPLALGYESSIFNQNFESPEEKRMQSFRPQLHDHWHIIDLDKENLSSLPSTVSAAPKKEGEEMWDFFGTFYKMRLALFRNWLKEFRKNAADLDEFSPLETPIELNLVELMEDTIQKLKFFSDEKGFVMIAVAPGNKMSSAVEILDKETSERDTLLVVAGVCSQGRKLIPFFARGPGSNYLYNAKTLWDLPLVVKEAVSGCQGIWCKVGPLNPVWDAEHDFHKRFARERFIRNAEQNSTVASNVTEAAKEQNSTVASNVTEAAKISNQTEVKIDNATVDHSKHNHHKPTNNSVQNSTKKPEVNSNESSSTKISENSVVKPVTKLSQTSTDNKNETSTQKAITENQAIVNQTSEADNTTEIEEVGQRILITGGASGFSMKTTSAIFGIMTSFATTTFLNF